MRSRKKHPKAILVTGCAGFIGSSFAAQFLKRFPRATVIGIDDLSEGKKSAVPAGVVFYKGSILEARLLDRLFKKHRPEYVFHFAARPRVSFSVAHPALSTEVNIVGTVRLLEKSREYGVQRFIFSSSSSVYGDAKTLPAREATHPPDPQSPYALQKYASERFCEQFSRFFGLETVCLRYFLAYGPGQYGDSAYMTVIAAWLESLYFPKRKEGFIEGDGTQSRDFSYIDDIVEANILAMRHPGPFLGETLNIASGKAYTINEVHERIERITGRKLELEQRPPRAGDVRRTLADIRNARRLLGYAPKVDFATGLARTVAWFEGRAAKAR